MRPALNGILEPSEAVCAAFERDGQLQICLSCGAAKPLLPNCQPSRMQSLTLPAAFSFVVFHYHDLPAVTLLAAQAARRIGASRLPC